MKEGVGKRRRVEDRPEMTMAVIEVGISVGWHSVILSTYAHDFEGERDIKATHDLSEAVDWEISEFDDAVLALAAQGFGRLVVEHSDTRGTDAVEIMMNRGGCGERHHDVGLLRSPFHCPRYGAAAHLPTENQELSSSRFDLSCQAGHR